MTKSEHTRQLIIERTAPVFNVQGFEGTSLASLEKATGLTRGSLYGHFAGKEELAREAFRYSMKVVRRSINEHLRGKATPKEKLLALLSFYAKFVFDPPVAGGCPLLNSAIEADDFHYSMKKLVAGEINRTVSVLEGIIIEGKKQKQFRKDVHARQTALLLFSAIEGALMVSRVSDSDEPMKAVVKQCNMLLDLMSQ
jgi:TetR/AcrR family transcriptional regulator, transcriptional repressor for nem operon